MRNAKRIRHLNHLDRKALYEFDFLKNGTKKVRKNSTSIPILKSWGWIKIVDEKIIITKY